jgi:hypothetical protein
LTLEYVRCILLSVPRDTALTVRTREQKGKTMTNVQRKEYAQWLFEGATEALKEVVAKKKGCGEAKKMLSQKVRILVRELRDSGLKVS